MSDPFLITGPALISFSGGRTSAYMLWRILQAHGGTLPPDVVVAFANTGKEREETLRFVHECGSRWGLRVRWLEWRHDGTSNGATEEVGFNSASRCGEPFDALIDHKQRLPNGRERWCTEFLKVRPLQALMGALGYGSPGEYTEVIGLRYDELDRVVTGRARAEKDGRNIDYPLVGARLTKRDVRAFWWGRDRRFETSEQPQGFDLGLPDLWGNCDFCFAMGVAIREERARQMPSVATWWSGAREARSANGRASPILSAAPKRTRQLPISSI
jgi:3'-phosphoadenosine 5'-phosphosulfate sulfotransferase (PAPS reductase)/FAD synthetase